MARALRAWAINRWGKRRPWFTVRPSNSVSKMYTSRIINKLMIFLFNYTVESNFSLVLFFWKSLMKLFMLIYRPTPYTVVTGSSCDRSGSWIHHHNPGLNFTMNTILKLGPPVHWSLGDAAGAVLSNNVTLRKDDAPYIHLCYIANERLVCVEASSKCVLILPYHGGTPPEAIVPPLFRPVPLATFTPSLQNL